MLLKVTLKGLVISKFGSATELGKALNWSGRRARSIVNGSQEPTVADIELLSTALGLTNANDFIAVFYPALSTKWNDKGQ